MARKTTKTAAAQKRITKNGAKKSAKVARKTAAKRLAAKPTLLSGGNPQIAKGYGDAPVQAYIAAMPGWKRDVGRRLDALIAHLAVGDGPEAWGFAAGTGVLWGLSYFFWRRLEAVPASA